MFFKHRETGPVINGLVKSQEMTTGNVSRSGGVVHYCRTQPPGAVFLACLLAFALTTTCLSFYVSHNQVRNPDVLDWNTLLLEAGKLHFCLGNQSSSVPKPSGNLDDRVNLSISVPMVVEPIHEMDNVGEVIAVSLLKLSDMSRHVPFQYKTEEIVISFVLNPQSKDDHLCVNIDTPKFILNTMQTAPVLPDKCSLATNKPIANVQSTSGDHIPTGWCNKGLIFQMAFESHPLWTVFVTPEDQTMIRMHLMVTSAFLFVLVGAILLGIFVKGLLFSKKSASSHQVLQEEEMDF